MTDGPSSHDTFDADWLTLREPVDHRSRPPALTETLAAWGSERGGTTVVDLGTGTGSNIRYLSPRLPWVQRWRAVDHDRELLDRLDAPAGSSLERVPGKLEIEGLEAIAGTDLVTASALLDLVSAQWVTAVSEQITRSGAAALFALSYDGSVAFDRASGFDGPAADPDDDFVIGALNRHQQQEKGLGHALGPDATEAMERALADRGYRCTLVASPWILEGRSDLPLARALMEGWVAAATELHPDESDRLARWLDRRTEAFGAGGLRITVGHLDLLALPTSG